MHQSFSPRLVLIAVFTMFLMSGVPVIIKAISANEISIGIVRLAIATLGTAAIFTIQKGYLRFQIGDLKWMFALGCIFAAHWFLYFKSVKTSTASLAAIAVSTYGIQLLLLSWISYGDKVRLIDSLALALAFAGVLIAAPQFELQPDAYHGFILGLISGTFYALLPLINRKAYHLGTNRKALGQFGFGLLCFLPFWSWGQWQLTLDDWIGLVVLGVVGTLIAHTLWIKVSTELPPKFTAAIYYIYIPLTMMLSAIFLEEPITATKIIGALCIIAGNLMIVLGHSEPTRKTADDS
ncbi:MAG: DMT family transporter [Pseudomonadota bacterium]